MHLLSSQAVRHPLCSMTTDDSGYGDCIMEYVLLMRVSLVVVVVVVVVVAVAWVSIFEG